MKLSDKIGISILALGIFLLIFGLNSYVNVIKLQQEYKTTPFDKAGSSVPYPAFDNYWIIETSIALLSIGTILLIKNKMKK